MPQFFLVCSLQQQNSAWIGLISPFFVDLEHGEALNGVYHRIDVTCFDCLPLKIVGNYAINFYQLWSNNATKNCHHQ